MRAAETEHGFTLIETLLVLAMVGILVAIALPNLARYQNREAAKAEAMQIAGALREARARAMKDGVPWLVIFNPNPAAAVPAGNLAIAPNTVARLVRDANNDGREGSGETVLNVVRQRLANSTVTAYGAGPLRPYPGTTLINTDRVNAGGTLNLIANGANFPLDTVSTAAATPFPAVGFTTRGVAVRVSTPTVVGSGAGSYYITDNQNGVYAASVGPLGEVRVRALSPGMNAWN